MSKIVQNVKFFPINQNTDLSSKSYSTSQNKSEGMLGFQIRTSKANKLKLHAKWCNKGLPQKMHFSTVARLTNLRPLLDSWHRNKSGNGIGFLFRVPVNPSCKIRQTLIDN